MYIQFSILIIRKKTSLFDHVLKFIVLMRTEYHQRVN